MGAALALALIATDTIETRGALIVSGLAWNWIVTLAIVGYVMRVEHRPLSSVGVRGAPWTHIATTPLWWLLGVIVTASVALPLRDYIDTTPAEALTSLPVAVRIGIVVTAPLTEELFFRGYVIERLDEMTGRLWFAAAVSTLVFAGLHIPYYGLLPGLVRIPISALLTIRYIKSRSIVPPIGLHFLIDLPLVFAGALPSD